MADSTGTSQETCNDHPDPFCEVCSETRGLSIKAEGLCKECIQFLCTDCLLVHTKLQATKNHVILRGDDMPKSVADKPPKFDHCDVHYLSKKDQFCGKHRGLVCSLCVPTQHKRCPVETVENVCKGILSSELDGLYDSVENFKENLLSIVSEVDQNVNELQQQRNDMLKEVQSVYEKTVLKVEKLFKDMKADIEGKYETEVSSLEHVQNKVKDTVTKLEQPLAVVDALKGNPVDVKVFLKVHGILKDIHKSQLNVKDLSQLMLKKKMSFSLNELYGDFLDSSVEMGTVLFNDSQSSIAIPVPEIIFPNGPTQSQMVSALSNITAKKLESFSVKEEKDKNECHIIGIVVLSDGRRLMADRNNQKIKLFSHDMKFLSSLSLPNRPWDIAVIGDREVVVSDDDEPRLLFLEILDSKMKIKRKVKLSFQVRGIAPYRDKLIVASWSNTPSSVKLIDQRGKIVWSTVTDQLGQELFIWPWYVASFDDGTSPVAIVADRSYHKVTVLNAHTGDVISRRHVKRKEPTGVTVDSAGNIYVCYYWTDEVAVLSKDLSEEGILLEKGDGLDSSPQAVAYDAVDGLLLVSNDYSESRNTVSCFQLH